MTHVSIEYKQYEKTDRPFGALDFLRQIREVTKQIVKRKSSPSKL